MIGQVLSRRHLRPNVNQGRRHALEPGEFDQSAPRGQVIEGTETVLERSQLPLHRSDLSCVSRPHRAEELTTVADLLGLDPNQMALVVG